MAIMPTRTGPTQEQAAAAAEAYRKADMIEMTVEFRVPESEHFGPLQTDNLQRAREWASLSGAPILRRMHVVIDSQWEREPSA